MKKEAYLYEKTGENQVVCKLCSHGCRIQNSKYGICRVRQNIDGTLYTYAYANPIAMHVDPIEKKPLYHFLPGTWSYSIATTGCNFQCEFCQNWQISQVSEGTQKLFHKKTAMPDDIVRMAKENSCQSISYTYTEPTIFFEYAYDSATIAHREGLKNVFVTNGYMTRDALDMIQPYLDAANVDLKSFTDQYYKKLCKARLDPVLDSIRYMHQLGIWIEITTLIVPGQNDSKEELVNIADYISNIDPGIPWHISRFFPRYHFDGEKPTTIETMKMAESIGKDHGLEQIHLGNV